MRRLLEQKSIEKTREGGYVTGLGIVLVGIVVVLVVAMVCCVIPLLTSSKYAANSQFLCVTALAFTLSKCASKIKRLLRCLERPNREQLEIVSGRSEEHR